MPTVSRAEQELRRLAARYLRLCRRHKRQVAIANIKVLDALVTSLPREVEDELRLLSLDETILSVLHHAPRIEAELGRQRTRIAAAVPVAAAEPEKSVPAGAQTRAPGPCHGCGAPDHWRRDCPYKDFRCETCHRIGHLSLVCKSVALKDSLGRIKHKVEPSAAKINVETRVDRTQADKVMTAQDMMNQIRHLLITKQQKASAKRAEKAAKSGKQPKPRKDHPVGGADPAPSDQEVHAALCTFLEESDSSESDGGGAP